MTAKTNREVVSLDNVKNLASLRVRNFDDEMMNPHMFYGSKVEEIFKVP